MALKDEAIASPNILGRAREAQDLRRRQRKVTPAKDFPKSNNSAIEKSNHSKGFSQILFLLAAAWLLFRVVPNANDAASSERYDPLEKNLTAQRGEIQQAKQWKGGDGGGDEHVDEEKAAAAAAQRAKQEAEDEAKAQQSETKRATSFEQIEREQSKFIAKETIQSGVTASASDSAVSSNTVHNSSSGVIDVSQDPRCKLVLSSSSAELAKAEHEFSQNKAAGIGPIESFSLGPCRYFYPQRIVPEGGYLNNIDWYFFRTVDPTSLKREECFVQCLALMETLSFAPKINHDMLAAAAFMGLQNATRVLMNKFELNPLHSAKGDSFAEKNEPRRFQPNAVQAAIMGGYAEVVKILTQSNMDLVIDEHGRTVKDYIQMPASPIRPYYAKKVLGITVNGELPSANSRGLEGVGSDESNGNDTISSNPKNHSANKRAKYNQYYRDSGWNSSTTIPFIDKECDFDVIDTAANDISFDVFLKDYYLPGRPVVLRNHVSKAEMQSFSKSSWSKLKHFHPSSEHSAGVTAYPSISQQKKCSHTMTIEQFERDERCAEMRDLHMMHAEHDNKFDEAYAMYDRDPTKSGAGFRKLPEWFPSEEGFSWQIFFGSDGSGATLHWHAAAFNILYAGMKEWHITPPKYRGFTGMTAQQVEAKIEHEPYTLKCTQLPGDMMYIPDHWGHMTINRGFGIGVAAIVGQNNRFIPGKIGQPGRSGNKNHRTTSRPANMGSKPNIPSVGVPGTIGKPRKEEIDTSNPKHGEGNKIPSTMYHRTARVSKSSIPFFFVHINKTGGTSLITMLGQHCTNEEYVSEHWKTKSGYQHRSFHSTAHSYIERHGRRVWDQAYTFAVVRHPLARQVSNFFFLVSNCEKRPKKCEGDNNDRIIPNNKIKSSSTEEDKINAFHEWIWNLYQAHPPGSPQHHLFGSKGHGNEEYPTMNATQTSWLVEETGQKIVVKTIFKLEHLSDNMKDLSQAIPCLAEAQAMIAKNQTPKYPHYSKFANNDRTNRIMREVFAADYVNFDYDLI